MKAAIILGSTGLIGRALARFLNLSGVETLCVGRRTLSKSEVDDCFGFSATYIRCPLETIEDLPGIISELSASTYRASVLYNVAWNGVPRLTEGGLELQLANVTYAANVIRAASQVGCKKVVSTGSTEETRAEYAMQTGEAFDSLQFDYTIAKLAARDMSMLISYLEKIDYIHTRLSIAIQPDLRGDGFVATNLRKIILGDPFQPPNNQNKVDITSTEDIARALFLIGVRGRNKANYYVGTGIPTTLPVYFKEFAEFVKNGQLQSEKIISETRDMIYDISEVYRDTGFLPASDRFETFLKRSHLHRRKL